MYTLFFEMLYYVLGVYRDQMDDKVKDFEGDFGDVNSFTGFFFIAFG